MLGVGTKGNPNDFSQILDDRSVAAAACVSRRPRYARAPAARPKAR